MIIIPFIHKLISEKDMDIHSIRMLTIGGKYLWEEESKQVKDILHSNGIYGSIKKNKNIYLCKVNKKTDINDMYLWKELDANDDTTFCWRDYVYFTGKNKECWLNISEKIGDISLADVSLDTIFKLIIKVI